MLKKVLSVFLAVLTAVSVLAVVPFSASAAETDTTGLTGNGVIYFDAASAGWENASNILFYIYEIGGDELAVWGSKKKLGGTKGDNNIWGFDAAKLGVVAGKQYGIIFNNFDANEQTYDLLLDTSCFGDTAFANPGKMIENPVESSESSMEARWTKSSYGPLLQITSIGSLIGETVPNNTSKYQMFVDFLASKDSLGLQNSLNYSGKTAQKAIDDLASALGLTKADVKKAIEEAKTKGHSDTGDKTDWSGQWDENKSTLSDGDSVSGKPDSSGTTGGTASGFQLATPQITKCESFDTGTKITWGAVSGAAVYRVYYKGKNGWVKMGDTTSTTFTDTNVSSGATCTYTVRCLDSAKKTFTSDYNHTGFTYTYNMQTPTVTSTTSSTSGVTIKWNAVPNAKKYRVYYKGANGWTKIADTASTSYLHTAASLGTTYTYTVRCINASANRFTSSFNGSGWTHTHYLTTPKITSIENTTSGAKLTWGKMTGAASYRIYYKSGSWTRIATTTKTEYVDTSVKDGQARVYTIRCLNDKGAFVTDYNHTGWSNTYIAAPVVSLSNGENGVNISWKASAGAARYRVYYYANNTWNRIADTTDTSYVDTTVKSGNTYTYTVRCLSADSKSFTSGYNSGVKIQYVAAPKITSLENTASGVKIKWNAEKGAASYRVYYKSGSWTRIATTTKTEYVDTSVKDGETRVYTVRCLNDKGAFVSDYNRTGWSNTYMAAPVVSLSNGENGVNISWKASAGAARYRVYYYANNTWNRIVDTADTSYVDTSVKAGNTYTYTVRCLSADGKSFTSGYNSGVKIQYVPAPKITAFDNIASGAKIIWNAEKGAASYRVYYKGSSGWTRIASTTNTEYVDTSVKDGETRVYTVRCLNNKGEFISDYNHTGWSNIFYAAPQISSVTYSDGAYTISWKERDGVAAYRLYRKTLGGSWARLTDKITETSYTDSTAKAGTYYTYTLRYLDENGNLISGYMERTVYYKDGVKANGNVSADGTYCFKDGYLMTGLNRVDGKLRCYNSEGRMYRDTIVGSASEGYYYTDADGICCETKEMCLAAEFIAKYCKGSTMKDKMKYGFMYMAKNYPYKRTYGDQPKSESALPGFATDLFTNKAGNCYRYAAAFACVAKIAGYRTRFCYGMSGVKPHGWTEVYVDGRWYLCDVDANIPSFGFPDYKAYMMKSHFWYLDKHWYSELTVKDGKATWGKKTNF